MNQLDAIKKCTVVVADSGDIESIYKFEPEDATTNPSIILKVASMYKYHSLIIKAIEYARKKGGNKKKKLINASDQLSVNIGVEMLKNMNGRISTEVDARMSFNRNMCIGKARKLIGMYQEQGIDKSRILIKLAATWEGIKAAEELEKEGINTNLTLLFSFAQARACAESSVYLISPFVGRIYDWYQNKQQVKKYDAEKDPGVQSVRTIYEYYKKHRYKTVIMGASFRFLEQIVALAGCDRLTISLPFLEKLKKNNKPVERKMRSSIDAWYQPKFISESEFHWLLNKNAMALEKLAEGIRLFTMDQNKLEAMLAVQL